MEKYSLDCRWSKEICWQGWCYFWAATFHTSWLYKQLRDLRDMYSTPRLIISYCTHLGCGCLDKQKAWVISILQATSSNVICTSPYKHHSCQLKTCTSNKNLGVYCGHDWKCCPCWLKSLLGFLLWNDLPCMRHVTSTRSFTSSMSYFPGSRGFVCGVPLIIITPTIPLQWLMK